MRGGQGRHRVGPRPHPREGPVHSLGYAEMVVIGSAEHPPGTSAGPAELSAADWVLHEPEQGMREVVEGLTGHFGLTPRAVTRTGQGAGGFQQRAAFTAGGTLPGHVRLC